MIVGYARVSTTDQSTETQEAELKALGCEKVYSDKASGGDLERTGLKEMLGSVREGDMVMCCKTDRIARDTIHALTIANELKAKGCGLKLLDLGDTDINSTMGRVIYTIISALAEAEKARIAERTKLGREAAIAKGTHMGRPQSINVEKIMILKAKGLGMKAIADEMQIARASVYRLLQKEEQRQKEERQKRLERKKLRSSLRRIQGSGGA